jgi:hypothetical protein
MTTETVTDYETREVQREVTTCDRDGCSHSSTDESEFIEVVANPDCVVSSETTVTLHEDVEGAANKLSRVDTHRLRRNHPELYKTDINNRLSETGDCFTMKTGETTERVEADVSLDVCERCFTTLFTDADVGNRPDIEVGHGGITVTEHVEEKPYVSVSLPNPAGVFERLEPRWLFVLSALIMLFCGVALGVML